MVLLASLAIIVVANANTASASHSWNGYHWARTSNPLSLKLGDNVSGSWDAVLAAASSDWSASAVLDTTVVAGGTNATKGRKTAKNCIPTSGRVEVCNAAYGSNGWLGLAQVWVSGSHITQGAVKLNDTYFKTSTYNNPNERLHVVCQEIGHTFGLDHQSEDGTSLDTCMDYFSNTGANAGSTVSTHPNQHDYDELVLIYAHLDSTNTAFASAPGGSRGKSANAGQDVDVSNPSAWGKEVSRDAHGKQSLFERDLGNGEKVFTFVTWATE